VDDLVVPATCEILSGTAGGSVLRFGPSEARAVASASNLKRGFKLLDFVKTLDRVAINNVKRKADQCGSKSYYHLSLKCTDFSRGLPHQLW
jgi:hypothetical protein